jgi:curved DNA-binding protein CbpA/ssDNA-binding Zn-finger/Zn-ribbon topoisomerase 1
MADTPMTDSQSHYNTLGVAEDASQDEIKDAFFKLVREHPPEQDPDAYQRLREAYDVLSDPVSRREYDTMARHGDEIESLREEAETLLNQEQPDTQTAIKKLKRATVLGPDISLLRNMLGEAYLIGEQPEKALKQFDEAVNLNPDNEAHHLNRGYALRELGRPRESEKAFRTVWEEEKGNYAAARGVAGALADRERFREAHEVLDEAIWADDTLNFEDFFCFYDKLHLYVAQDETDALERALDTVTDMAETPEDRQYAAFMLVQAADELQAAGAFGLAHRFGEAAKELDERSVDPDVVEQVGELRDLEEAVEAIVDSDRYHEAVKQMVAIYYDQFTGAMSERQAEEATDNLLQGLDNLMQADPDHTEIKKSLRRIRSRHPKAFDLNPEFFESILEVPGAELFVDDCPRCGERVMAEKGFSGEMQCPHCSRSVYSDGEGYYTSRSASRRQSSTSARSDSTKGRSSGNGSHPRKNRSGDGSKKFVCRDCSTVKYKGENITGTKCPECGRPMRLASNGNKSSRRGSRGSGSSGNSHGKATRSDARSCVHDYDGRDVCRKCGWSRSELKKIDTGRSSRSTNTDSGGGDCFVATAVYGDYDHPDVRRLRRFRDETLRHTAWGRAFIASYYRHGSSLAERLERHQFLKRGVRRILRYFVNRWLR